MSTISCYKQACKCKIEFSCNCTSPEIYSCKKHLVKHCNSSSKNHNISSIFLSPAEGTKEAVLSFLIEQKSKAISIKTKLLASFNQTLYSYKAAFEEALKELDFDSAQMSYYYEKVKKAQKISRIEYDPALSLLILNSFEAVEKAKAIFTASIDFELFYELNSQINKAIKNFKEENFKAIQQKTLQQLENKELISLEKDELMMKTLNHFKEAIRADPCNGDAYYGIGCRFYYKKRYEESIKYFNYAIRSNPNIAIYYKDKGNALKKIGRKEEAIDCYKKVIEIDSDDDNDDIYGKIGKFFYEKNKYEEAIKYYNDAIRKNPEYEEYHINKASALTELCRWEEAVECYKVAIRIYPYKVDLYNNSIGQIFFDKKRYEEALKYYSSAITHNSNNPKHYEKKGFALFYLGRKEEAIECFKEAIIIDPKNDSAYNNIGVVLFDEKRYEEAIKYYSSAITINPNHAKYLVNKGNALRVLGKTEEAIPCYWKAINIDPNADDAYSSIGDAFFDTNIYDEAVKFYNDAIRINPNNKKNYRKKRAALQKLESASSVMIIEKKF